MGLGLVSVFFCVCVGIAPVFFSLRFEFFLKSCVMRCQSWDISLVALGVLEPLIFALVTAVLASHRPAPTFLIEETVLALCKVEVLVATFAKEGVDHSMHGQMLAIWQEKVCRYHQP